MDKRMRFYSWLISLLEKKHLTLAEIIDEWSDATVNSENEELDQRTFHRYRENILSLFGVSVLCNRHNGYRYYVERDPVENNKVTEWMLSSVRLASLGDKLKNHNKVMLDTPPYNSEYLDDVLEAIDKQYLLKFKYVTAFGKESGFVLQPAFVRYFKQRWYVIGVKMKGQGEDGAKADEENEVRCLPFDRISFLDLIRKKHPLSKKMMDFLTPESYYEDCFGIYHMEDVPVEDIRIRVFYPEYNYIEEVPLHESQRKVKEYKDGLYREYMLRLRPTRDFLQELLWHGRGITVLKPESLRLQMIDILKKMTESYESGECKNGEE